MGMKLKKPANPVWTLLQRRYLILKTIPLTVLSRRNFTVPYTVAAQLTFVLNNLLLTC